MTRNEAHPIELAALALLALGWAVWQITRLLLVPAAALLLTLAGWRPAPQPQPVAPASDEASPAPIASPEAPTPLPQAPAFALACAPEPVAIAAPPLAGLTVAELRRLARAAGLPRTLSRSGRRAQLLEALAAA